MHENFVTDMCEERGDVYYSSYITLRKILIESQLHISNELEKHFNEFRLKAAGHINDIDMYVDYASIEDTPPQLAEKEKSSIKDKFFKETGELMDNLIVLIDSDVKKLRSRIEIDKA